MAHSASAKKRVRQNTTRRAVNRTRKGKVKAQIICFDASLEAADHEKAGKEFRLAVKKLDQAASTSTMHKRTAARKKSQLARRLNELSAKTG